MDVKRAEGKIDSFYHAAAATAKEAVDYHRPPTEHNNPEAGKQGETEGAVFIRRQTEKSNP